MGVCLHACVCVCMLVHYVVLVCVCVCVCVCVQDLKECDMLVVMGTSLVVQPFASLVHR